MDDRRIAPPGLGPDGDGAESARVPAPEEAAPEESAGEEAAPEASAGQARAAARAALAEAEPETEEPAGEPEMAVGWRRRWGPTARVVLFALVGAAGALSREHAATRAAAAASHGAADLMGAVR